jgi:hypothetical protein
LETIRSLLKDAGGEHELQAWIKRALGKRGRGRQSGWSPYGERDRTIIMFARFIVAKGLVKKFHTAVRFLVGQSVRFGATPPQSEESTIGRIANKNSIIKDDLPELTEAFPHLVGRTRLQLENELGKRREALTVDPKDPNWDIGSRWRGRKRFHDK